MRRLAPLVMILGCTAEVVVPEGFVDPECADQAFLEVVVVDVWGRPLAAEPATPLTPDVPVSRSLSAPGFLSADVTATWSGTLERDAVAVTPSAAEPFMTGPRVAVSLDVRDVAGRACAVYGLFVGLDHPWYASEGRAPTAGNAIEFLMDGEELWGRMHADLTAPGERVHQSTWWWESDHELVRTGEADRDANTMLGLMRARGGEHRVLVARFAADTAPGLAYQNNDAALRAHAQDPDDGIEAILQGNPTLVRLPGHYDVPARPWSFVARLIDNEAFADRTFAAETDTTTGALTSVEAGSYHQKTMAIDGRIAYVSGMNVKNQDWDGTEHRLFDARRMRYEATVEERAAVEAKEALPDWAARKDYGVRLEGPGARQVDAILKERWDLARATGELYAEHATEYELLPAAAPAGDLEIQMLATSPEPLQERSILESHLKASSRATDFVLIEDQYWRAPILLDAMTAAMDANPDLHMVVITQVIGDNNGAKKYSHLMDDALRSRYPDRYLLLQIKTFDRDANGDPIFQSIFLHSKLHIVDDRYLSVGSCNKNNRGYLFEGELNVAILDPDFVQTAKDRVVANLVGDEAAASVMGQDGATIFAVMKQLSESNAEAEALLLADPTADIAPAGFVYPLEMTDHWVLDVGPDLF